MKSSLWVITWGRVLMSGILFILAIIMASESKFGGYETMLQNEIVDSTRSSARTSFILVLSVSLACIFAAFVPALALRRSSKQLLVVALAADCFLLAILMLVYVGVAPRSGRFGNICSGCLDVEELKFLADVQNEFRGGCLGCKLPSCVFSHQECLAGLRDTFPQFKTSVPTLKRFDVENMCSVVPQCDILGATRQNRRDCVKIGNWTCKQKPESEVCVMADNSKQWESEGSFKAFDRRFKDTCCTLAPLVHAIVWLLLVNTCVLLVAIIFDVGATFCCPEQFDPQWGKAKVHQYGHGGDAEGDHEAPTTNVHRVNPAGSHYPGHPPYPPPYPQTQSLPAPGKYAAGEGPFEGNSILYEGGTAAVTTGIPVERGTEGARAETQTQQQGVVALHSSGHEPAVLGRSREDLEEDAETQC